MKYCKTCESEVQIEEDTIKGQSFCLQCGALVAQDNIHNELMFNPSNQKATGTFIRGGNFGGKLAQYDTSF